MAFHLDPIVVKVGNRIHVAAQAVTDTGIRGPLLSAPGCNLDKSEADHVVETATTGIPCERCHAPITGEDS